MGSVFEYVKDTVVNFRLRWCCWVAPVRIGLIITAYFNIILAVISLVGIADDSFVPILVLVQATIFEDDVNKGVPMLAYSVELAFNVILLCAIHRKDLTLMRVYMKYCFAAIITSIMFYSMVVAAIGVIVAVAMVLSILFQIYVLILVRSIIVEIKLEQRKVQIPTLVMSTLIQEDKEKTAMATDVEAPEIPEEEPKRPESRLETVDENPEHPKEETVTNNDKE